MHVTRMHKIATVFDSLMTVRPNCNCATQYPVIGLDRRVACRREPGYRGQPSVLAD